MDRELAQGLNYVYTLTHILSLSIELGYQQPYREAEELNRKALDGLNLI